jgi:hypothetical protein
MNTTPQIFADPPQDARTRDQLLEDNAKLTQSIATLQNIIRTQDWLLNYRAERIKELEAQAAADLKVVRALAHE